jgi:hypothetical protein
MAVLPPDPVFCLKSDMGHVHSLCFPITNESYASKLLAAAENGFIYFWDLEVSNLPWSNLLIKNLYLQIFCHRITSFSDK